MFDSKEIKDAKNALRDCGDIFAGEAFDLVKQHIEKLLKDYPDELSKQLKVIPPKNWVYSMITNIAGDLAASGQYHIYRGVLNPLGPGQGLLRLYDAAMEDCVKMGLATKEFAEEQKKIIRGNLKDVG